MVGDCPAAEGKVAVVASLTVGLTLLTSAAGVEVADGGSRCGVVGPLLIANLTCLGTGTDADALETGTGTTAAAAGAGTDVVALSAEIAALVISDWSADGTGTLGGGTTAVGAATRAVSLDFRATRWKAKAATAVPSRATKVF